MELTLPIRIEKTTIGYRAISGEPIPLQIEASTREEAIDQLRCQAQHQFENGVEFVTLRIPHLAKMQAPILPDDEVTREWLEIIAENRRILDDEEAKI